MHPTLRDFCETLRDRPCNALETLLKVAETKDALLNWEQAVTLMPPQDDGDEGPKCIATALALALVQIDRAEATILDAFCLSQQRQYVSKTQTV